MKQTSKKVRPAQLIVNAKVKVGRQWRTVSSFFRVDTFDDTNWPKSTKTGSRYMIRLYPLVNPRSFGPDHIEVDADATLTARFD